MPVATRGRMVFVGSLVRAEDLIEKAPGDSVAVKTLVGEERLKEIL